LQVECWGALLTFDVLPNGVDGPWLAFLASMRRILAREVRLADVPSIVLRHIEVLVQLEDTLPFSELGGFLHLTLELALDMAKWPIRPISMMSFEGSAPIFSMLQHL
jgi:hypothetical protein